MQIKKRTNFERKSVKYEPSLLYQKPTRKVSTKFQTTSKTDKMCKIQNDWDQQIIFCRKKSTASFMFY